MAGQTKEIATDNYATVAEKNVIGAILISEETLALVREIVKPSDFYLIANQEIFRTMCELEDNGHPINIATIFSKLSSSVLFNEIGGIQYLMDCESQLPSASTILTNANIVRMDSIRRKIGQFGDKLKVISTKPLEDADSTVSQLVDELSDLSNISSVQPWQDFNSALKGTFAELETQDEDRNITSGFIDLDSKLTGFKPGALTIVAARPAMGKTAFGLNILSHVAIEQNIPVAFFSLEMTTIELTYRLVSSLSMVNGNAIRQKRMNDDEWNSLIEVAQKYSKAQIYIDETPAIDISLLRERAKRLYRQHGIGLVIVDYLQLMHAENKRVLNREQEVATISRGLKSLAKELHIPVIALSQLNRALDTRADKHPILSDLRESGAIEQDSDNILFIHREDYYRQDDQKDNTAEIIVAKQRSGPTGVVRLHWAGEYTKFSNLETRNYE